MSQPHVFADPKIRLDLPDSGDITDPRWTREEHYHTAFLVKPDPALEHALENSKAKGLPDIAVSPLQGKHLNLLARTVGARRILELGTLGGYSTIWMAKALPEDGKLVTCEYSAEYAEIAQENIAHASLSEKVEIMVGPASESLTALTNEGAQFDFVFIDADKSNSDVYWRMCKPLVRSGGIIIVDNIVRSGRVSDLSITDNPSVNGIRRMLELVRADDGVDVEATTLQLVGEKEWDGFLYALKL